MEDLEKELNSFLMQASLDLQWVMDLPGSVQTRSYIKSIQGIKKIRGARQEFTEALKMFTGYLVFLDEMESRFEKQAVQIEMEIRQQLKQIELDRMAKGTIHREPL